MTVKRFVVFGNGIKRRKKPLTLKNHLKKYLDSKLRAGGLYGLTISNPHFVNGLIRVIKQHIK
jgi:hypothetical protein